MPVSEQDYEIKQDYYNSAEKALRKQIASDYQNIETIERSIRLYPNDISRWYGSKEKALQKIKSLRESAEEKKQRLQQLQQERKQWQEAQRETIEKEGIIFKTKPLTKPQKVVKVMEQVGTTPTGEPVMGFKAHSQGIGKMTEKEFKKTFGYSSFEAPKEPKEELKAVKEPKPKRKDYLSSAKSVSLSQYAKEKGLKESHLKQMGFVKGKSGYYLPIQVEGEKGKRLAKVIGVESGVNGDALLVKPPKGTSTVDGSPYLRAPISISEKIQTVTYGKSAKDYAIETARKLSKQTGIQHLAVPEAYPTSKSQVVVGKIQSKEPLDLSKTSEFLTAVESIKKGMSIKTPTAKDIIKNIKPTPYESLKIIRSKTPREQALEKIESIKKEDFIGRKELEALRNGVNTFLENKNFYHPEKEHNIFLKTLKQSFITLTGPKPNIVSDTAKQSIQGAINVIPNMIIGAVETARVANIALFYDIGNPANKELILEASEQMREPMFWAGLFIATKGATKLVPVPAPVSLGVSQTVKDVGLTYASLAGGKTALSVINKKPLDIPKIVGGSLGESVAIVGISRGIQKGASKIKSKLEGPTKTLTEKNVKITAKVKADKYTAYKTEEYGLLKGKKIKGQFVGEHNIGVLDKKAEIAYKIIDATDDSAYMIKKASKAEISAGKGKSTLILEQEGGSTAYEITTKTKGLTPTKLKTPTTLQGFTYEAKELFKVVTRAGKPIRVELPAKPKIIEGTGRGINIQPEKPVAFPGKQLLPAIPKGSKQVLQMSKIKQQFNYGIAHVVDESGKAIRATRVPTVGKGVSVNPSGSELSVQINPSISKVVLPDMGQIAQQISKSTQKPTYSVTPTTVGYGLVGASGQKIMDIPTKTTAQVTKTTTTPKVKKLPSVFEVERATTTPKVKNTQKNVFIVQKSTVYPTLSRAVRDVTSFVKSIEKPSPSVKDKISPIVSPVSIPVLKTKIHQNVVPIATKIQSNKVVQTQKMLQKQLQKVVQQQIQAQNVVTQTTAIKPPKVTKTTTATNRIPPALLPPFDFKLGGGIGSKRVSIPRLKRTTEYRASITDALLGIKRALSQREMNKIFTGLERRPIPIARVRKRRRAVRTRRVKRKRKR